MTVYYIVAQDSKGRTRIVGEGFGKADASAQMRRWQARYPKMTFRLERD